MMRLLTSLAWTLPSILSFQEKPSWHQLRLLDGGLISTFISMFQKFYSVKKWSAMRKIKLHGTPCTTTSDLIKHGVTIGVFMIILLIQLLHHQKNVTFRTSHHFNTRNGSSPNLDRTKSFPTTIPFSRSD